MFNLKLTLAVIFAFTLVWGTMFLTIPKHGVVVYDCRLAEISPDFPVEVRNDCRKLNRGRI
jgi:hypothetical protein